MGEIGKKHTKLYLKSIGVEFNVSIPTAQDIFAITPLPWATGRSWAEGIELTPGDFKLFLNEIDQRIDGEVFRGSRFELIKLVEPRNREETGFYRLSFSNDEPCFT